MFNSRRKDFLSNLKQVAGTEAGKKLFKYLQEDYVYGSAIKSTTELTYKALAEKELVQGLIQDSKLKEEDLEFTATINNYEG